MGEMEESIIETEETYRRKPNLKQRLQIRWVNALEYMKHPIHILELKIERALKELPPMGVTAHTRYDGETEYLFVQNYNDTPVDILNLKGEYVNMETQERISATDIEAFGVRILKKER